MATAILLPAPELQFCDADGKPYAGGSLATYVPGTTTPKACWLDPGEAALQTNPVILDAAGRCILYGSGDYRLILRDAAGNLIYDQLSSTVVSDAMMPVVSAPTIADAQNLLGITGLATSAALASAISTEQTARIAADTAETNARTAADANLQSQIDTINATLAGLGGGGGSLPILNWGLAAAPSGHVRVTFSTPYTTFGGCVASIVGTAFTAVCIEVQGDNTGADIYVVQTDNLPAVAPVYWVAIGT
jgi:hypothetical protein